MRILDLSDGAEDNIVEDIGGFDTLMHANAFARRYVRDSVERCRVPGMSGKDVLDAWFAYGEDVKVRETESGAVADAGWRSATELSDFAGVRASAEERDWRALDPRRIGPDDDDGDADDGPEAAG